MGVVVSWQHCQDVVHWVPLHPVHLKALIFRNAYPKGLDPLAKVLLASLARVVVRQRAARVRVHLVDKLAYELQLQDVLRRPVLLGLGCWRVGLVAVEGEVIAVCGCVAVHFDICDLLFLVSVNALRSIDLEMDLPCSSYRSSRMVAP